MLSCLIYITTVIYTQHEMVICVFSKKFKIGNTMETVKGILENDLIDLLRFVILTVCEKPYCIWNRSGHLILDSM